MRLSLALAALAVAGAVLPLALTDPPLLEVRQRPYSLHAGALLPGEPIGERVLCAADGLYRVDVHFAPLGPQPAGALELRVLDEQGRLLRRRTVQASELAPDGWLAFELEPLTGCAGRELVLEILAAGAEVALTPHLRWRGRVGTAVLGVDHAWGDRGLSLPRLEREVFSSDPDLAGLALPFDSLDPSAGIFRAALLADDGAELRSAAAIDGGRTRAGHRLFTFPPLAESRFRRLGLVLENPGAATVVGDEHGPGYATLHRRGPGRESAALGAVLHGEERRDVDLCVRLFASEAPSALERARGRLGARAPLSLALLALGAFALGRVAAALVARDARR